MLPNEPHGRTVQAIQADPSLVVWGSCQSLVDRWDPDRRRVFHSAEATLMQVQSNASLCSSGFYSGKKGGFCTIWQSCVFGLFINFAWNLSMH